MNPCVDCIDLVGAGPNRVPHAALTPAPDAADKRAFNCAACNAGWTCGQLGWSRSAGGVDAGSYKAN